MYGAEDKIKTLVLLRENGFNLRKTSKQTGISEPTLTKWRRTFGDDVYKDLDKKGEGLHLNETYDSALTSVAKELKDIHEDFISKVLQTKLAAIDKVKSMLEKEKDLNKVTTVLKTLHDITMADTVKGEGEKANTYMAFLVDVYNLKR